MKTHLTPAAAALALISLAACSDPSSPPPSPLAKGPPTHAPSAAPRRSPIHRPAPVDPPATSAAGGAAGAGGLGVERGDAVPYGPAPDSPAPALVAARTIAGDLAFFDAATGAILAQAASGGLLGEIDLACDPWHHRLLTFEGDEEAQWGEIASYPIAREGQSLTLGPRQHQVWIDGIARVAPSPFGALVFEESYGPRWRLLPTTGEPSPSVYAPRPRSLQLGPLADGQFQIAALTRGVEGNSLDLRAAAVLPAGVQAPVVTPLDPPLSPASPDIQWISSPTLEYLATVSAGDIVVSSRAAGAPFPPFAPLGVGPGIERVLQALVLPGERLALLTEGASHLVVASFDDDLEVDCVATLLLPSPPAGDPPFFTRALLAAGPHRLLAATPAGVFAVSLTDACPLTLTLDPAFSGDALRDPIDACETPP